MHWSEVQPFSSGEDGDTDCRLSAAGARKQTMGSHRHRAASEDLAHNQIWKFEAEAQVQGQDKAGNEFQIPYLHQKFAHIQYKY